MPTLPSGRVFALSMEANCEQARFQLKTCAVRAALCSFVWRMCARRAAGIWFTATRWSLPRLVGASRGRLWRRYRRLRVPIVPCPISPLDSQLPAVDHFFRVQHFMLKDAYKGGRRYPDDVVITVGHDVAPPSHRDSKLHCLLCHPKFSVPAKRCAIFLRQIAQQ